MDCTNLEVTRNFIHKQPLVEIYKLLVVPDYRFLKITDEEEAIYPYAASEN